MAENQDFPFPVTSANRDFPFNPFADGTVVDSRGNRHKGAGDWNDPARYMANPGVAFQRPWLAVPGGRAFIWPLGVEGLVLDVSPTLGIHRYIGDNKVTVDVVHKGEEHYTMTGSFVGATAASASRSLRDVVYADTPEGGKILALPGILPYAQRVAVANFNVTRSKDERGGDFEYTIELVRTGLVNAKLDALTAGDLAVSPTTIGNVSGQNIYKTTATVNTLRKIALALWKDAGRWSELYAKNKKKFAKVPSAQIPSHKLPIGTAITY